VLIDGSIKSFREFEFLDENEVGTKTESPPNGLAPSKHWMASLYFSLPEMSIIWYGFGNPPHRKVTQERIAGWERQ